MNFLFSSVVYILFVLVYSSCIGIWASVWCATWCTWTSLVVNAYRLLLWHNFTSAVQINVEWVCGTDKCNNNGNKAWLLFRMCLLIQDMLKVALPSFYIAGNCYFIYNQPATDNDSEELRKLFRFLSTTYCVVDWSK